eukprot:TRINITY_DN14424_c0_g1_i1.p1 TRINITY_DN14424_c0_g1~~TRINITY_DN14424_c0_g1_i1.p1  ORF type:complete len:615 (+),score=118.41 TRINITY_DN14424_c0_g1_i1:61-1845(+)
MVGKPLPLPSCERANGFDTHVFPKTKAFQAHREMYNVELEVKELEAASEEVRLLEAEHRQLKQRLQYVKRTGMDREKALREEIHRREEELHRVQNLIVEERSDEAASEPQKVLRNAEPLGESIASSLQSLREPQFGGFTPSSSSRMGRPPLACRNPEASLEDPTNWPTLASLGDLWCASSQIEAALDWRESSRGLPLALEGYSPLDAAEELAMEASREVLRQSHASLEQTQKKLQSKLSKTRERMRIVLGATPPLLSKLATEEHRRCELLDRQEALLQAVVSMENRVEALKEAGKIAKTQSSSASPRDDATKVIERVNSKGKAASPDETERPKRAKSVVNEHESLQKRLQKWLQKEHCSAEQVNQDFPPLWKVIMHTQLQQMHEKKAIRRELRSTVAGAEAAAVRHVSAPSARQMKVAERTRSVLQNVVSMATEGLEVLDPVARWCSSAEASLVLAALSQECDRWQSLASAPPPPMCEELDSRFSSVLKSIYRSVQAPTSSRPNLIPRPWLGKVETADASGAPPLQEETTGEAFWPLELTAPSTSAPTQDQVDLNAFRESITQPATFNSIPSAMTEDMLWVQSQFSCPSAAAPS